MRDCTNVHARRHVRTYTYIHIHTHTHTHIPIQIYKELQITISITITKHLTSTFYQHYPNYTLRAQAQGILSGHTARPQSTDPLHTSGHTVTVYSQGMPSGHVARAYCQAVPTGRT